MWFTTPGAGVTYYDGLRWRYYTQLDGLGSNIVNDLAEAPNGDIWFATTEGLTRFDGRMRITYSTVNGLPGNYALEVLVDRAGRVWVLTASTGYRADAISVYDGDSWTPFRASDNPGFRNIANLLESPSGDIWIRSTTNGVSRYDGSWRNFGVADGLPADAVYAMAADRSSGIWISTTAGIARFDSMAWVPVPFGGGVLLNVGQIFEDRRGDVWFSFFTSPPNLVVYSGGSWQTFTTSSEGGPDFVAGIDEDQHGRLWFSPSHSSGGLTSFDGRRWRTYTRQDGLPQESIRFLTEDGDGNLWFTLGLRDGLVRYDGSSWATTGAVDLGTSIFEGRGAFEDRNGNIWFRSSFSGDGVVRFNGRRVERLTTADGLPTNGITIAVQDRSGALWFTAGFEGVYRLADSTWTRFPPELGAPTGANYSAADSAGTVWFMAFSEGVFRNLFGNWRRYTPDTDSIVRDPFIITADRAGGVWVAGSGGASHFDGMRWRTYGRSDSLTGVREILVDRRGNVWFATHQGVVRFDGMRFARFTTAHGLGSDIAKALFEDREGNIWAGTWESGVSRWDGMAWQTFSISEGLGGSVVRAIAEDANGNMWFGLSGGASRFDGLNWGTYRAEDGLGSDEVYHVFVDSAGEIWFGTSAGIARHEPDRVPPRTIIVAQPPRASAGQDHTIPFTVAHKETRGVTFSHAFDGALWTPWSSDNVWVGTDLSNGPHVFRVRSRDQIGNVDSAGAIVEFEVDATPPTPFIAFPGPGQAVRDSIAIAGTADDTRFRDYRLDLRPSSRAPWNPADATPLGSGTTPVVDGILGGLQTRALADGPYDLRLSVLDTLGLVGIAQVTMIVDNQAPPAGQTSPAILSAAQGGDIYTTNAEVHLYFPPHAFVRDALVRIDSLEEADVPVTLPDGSNRLSAGHALDWGGSALEKDASLDLSYGGAPPPGRTAAIYFRSTDKTWTRVGGTATGQRISALVRSPGHYAVFADLGSESEDGGLSPLSFTPRVFSPAGTFANDHVAIGFTLGRAATVTVRVYTRGGRLVREVVSGQAMGPGANLVRWDGRDRDGVEAADGVYVVTVEALGQTRRNALAVVR